MHRRKFTLTLGDVIQTVAEFSRNHQETSLVVADLLQRGVVRLRRRHKYFKNAASRS